MSSVDVVSEINNVASEINKYILENVCGEPTDLYQSSLHYIKSGGKRLRPFMAVKSSELFGGTLGLSLPAASAVELIHNFTLVHDDIMDNDNLRHNVPTVHKEFGIPLAILSGDVLFSKAFHIISHLGKKSGIGDSTLIKMIELLSSSCIDVCEGQSMDIQMAQDSDFSSKDYYINMIKKKTAALFRVSCELGTLSSQNFSNKDLENMSGFGEKIGISFQLVDDLIGIHGDSNITGKFVGNDIREGKKTLPILIASEQLDSQGRDLLQDVFGKKDASESEIKQVVNNIAQLNIDKEIRNIANAYTQEAFEHLQTYENSSARTWLETSARYIVERSL
ncbi:MAG TPA: polyprenyl synthetase family protein [Candidatus Nitrosocosmicus sp.]|nr:polyprenyl synthetase family protein [Candidatus Nitrosocosmicus sp.]